MERIKKFRVWDGKKMHYPDENNFEKLVICSTGKLGEFNGSTYDTREYPTMDFTGLLDKHGKEIYEGDILFSKSWGSNSRTKNPYHVVEWNGCGWKAVGYNGDMKVNPDLDVKRDFEIVGNLFETPNYLTKNNSYGR